MYIRRPPGPLRRAEEPFYPWFITPLFPLANSSLFSVVLEFNNLIFGPGRSSLLPLGGSESAISDGGGVGFRAPGPSGSLARCLSAALGRPRPPRIEPRAPRSEPRAPKIDPRLPQDPVGTTQERSKSLQERPKTTSRGTKSDPRAPKSDPGEARISKIIVFPYVFHCFLKIRCLQPRPLENRC